MTRYLGRRGLLVPVLLCAPPRARPRTVINALHAATQKVLAEPDTKQLLASQGVLPLESASPEEFARFFRADFDRVAKLISIAGIKPE